jgi:hypothetical protein
LDWDWPCRFWRSASFRASAGGWSDLHPSLVLRNMGCDQVIYVTRRGQESGFAQGVAGLLGMTDEQKTALYDLGADSSCALSIAESSAVWCTDWNRFSGTQLAEIFEDAYNAPLETFAGCTHGVSESSGPGYTPLLDHPCGK